MNELTCTEMDLVSGGNPVVIGIGVGIAANYVYDSVGGYEGINAGLAAAGNYFVEAWENDPIVSMF